MKTKINKWALNAVASAALLAGATPAYAICDMCVAGAVATASAAIVLAVGTTTTAVGSAATAITTGVTTNSRLIVQAVKGGASTVSQVVKETGTIQSETALLVSSQERLRAIERRYAVTDPCSIGAPSQGMADVLYGASQAGSSSPGRGGGGGAPRGPGGGTKQLKTAIDIAEGRTAAPAPDIAAAMAAAGGCGSFSANTKEGALRFAACKAAGLNPGLVNGHPNADLSAKTLFDGPQKPGEKRKKFSVDYTPDSAEEVAVSAFVRNLNTPLELRALGNGELSTDAGRRYLAVKDIYEARMSFAERPIAMHKGYQAKTVSTIPMLKELSGAEGDPAFVSAYLAKNAPDWQSKGVSADEILNLEVERRYMNLDWLAKVSGKMTPEEVAKEHLRLTALQNVLLWQSNQQARETAILIGGLVGSSARVELLPELKAAHAAATR